MSERARLLVAGWEITRRCNFRCRHCFTSSGSPLENELTTDEGKDLLDQLAAMGVPVVSLSGGEPLLRDDLFTLLEHGRQAGIREYTLVSNGFLVKRETLRRLKGLGLSSFQVSIDGADPAAMAAIRGGGPKAFDRALRAIRLSREAGLYTVLGTFIHPRNVASLPAILRLASREKVDLVRLSGFVPLGRGESEEILRENTLTEEQKEALARFVVDEILGRRSGVPVVPDHAFGPFTDGFRCEAGLSAVYIGAAGDVFPCPSLSRSEFLVGNVRTRPLTEIWSDPRMTASHRRDHQRIGGECAGCRHLERCRGGCRGKVYCLTGELDAPFPDCFVARVERLRSPSTPPPRPALESGGAYPFLLQEQLLQTYRRYAERNIQMLANPYPRYLIWETTRNCNLACAHCAVPRTTWEAARELTTEQAKSVFSQLAADYPPSSVQMLALSGGEPLLRGDLVEMVGFLTALGYPVGLDSNGLLLGRRPDLLDRLVAAGLKYPCLSLDGLKSSHDGLRGAPCHDEVVSAISHIIRKHPQVPLQTITMVTPFNIDELDGIAALLDSLGVRRARFSTVYRSGRAKEHPENCLDDPGHARLLRWIAGMRRRFFDGETPLLVEFTDDGWCGRAIDGVGLEGLVRNSLFFCQAGISLAVINYDGGLSACMSLPEERSRQGSLLDESFRTIWESRFRSFRDRGRLWRDACVACTEWNFCLGGAMHHRAADGALQECPHLRLQRGAGGCR